MNLLQYMLAKKSLLFHLFHLKSFFLFNIPGLYFDVMFPVFVLYLFFLFS